MKKSGYLILIFLISIVMQVIMVLQDLVLAIATMIVIFVNIFPFISFFYSKLLISNGHNRLLLSLLCPATLTLSYVALFFDGDEAKYLYSLILFAWCELWSLLGLIKRKHKTQIGKSRKL